MPCPRMAREGLGRGEPWAGRRAHLALELRNAGRHIVRKIIEHAIYKRAEVDTITGFARGPRKECQPCSRV
eukprot:14588102-Heterocapsa_arctica.AAC.1